MLNSKTLQMMFPSSNAVSCHRDLSQNMTNTFFVIFKYFQVDKQGSPGGKRPFPGCNLFCIFNFVIQKTTQLVKVCG